ncbi:MAG TPA: TIM barrel protein [Steroidobacteraceae bacterium]|nr:TIM barrel protein [Steroidobacteraceae bacterium]
MLNFSANLSLLFRELPLLERFAAAAACGFSAVEIQVPYEFPAATLASAAREAGVRVVLINAPMGEHFGRACRAEQSSLFRADLERAAQYAAALGAPCVNVLAGCAAPDERAACLAYLAESLSLAAELLAAVAARPLLEVLNPLDLPGYCVGDFELAAQLLPRCDARVGLQFDVYHAARCGLDPVAAFTRHLLRTAHVQFADCPGRHEPGTGNLDFGRIFDAIGTSGYRGWVGAEYHPTGATAASLAWLRPTAQG